MRKTILQVIASNPIVTGEIPMDNWHVPSTLKTSPARPFGTYRLAGSGMGVTRRSASKEVRLEIWVHDNPGSYLRIDRLLTELEKTFGDVTHVSAAEGESISQAAYDSRSPDLDDQGFGTICKSVVFTLIGKGQ